MIMKSQLQDLVRKIFSEENTKAEFVRDPESVMSKFSLTEHEKKAVLTTHAKLGVVSGDSAQLAATIKPMVNWFAPTP